MMRSAISPRLAMSTRFIGGTAGKTGKEVQEVFGGKEVKSVAEVQPVNSVGYAPADIRSIYMIQPSASAVVVKECVVVVEKKTPPKRHPQSPSVASHR